MNPMDILGGLLAVGVAVSIHGARRYVDFKPRAVPHRND